MRRSMKSPVVESLSQSAGICRKVNIEEKECQNGIALIKYELKQRGRKFGAENEIHEAHKPSASDDFATNENCFHFLQISYNENILSLHISLVKCKKQCLRQAKSLFAHHQIFSEIGNSQKYELCFFLIAGFYLSET